MWLICCSAQSLLAVFLVVGIVTFKPDNFGISLESKDMGGNPIEKPAIMADNHRTPAKVFQRLFQRTERIDIEIVGGFIKEQDVPAFFQHFGEMNAVALTAGQQADLLLLIGA